MCVHYNAEGMMRFAMERWHKLVERLVRYRIPTEDGVSDLEVLQEPVRSAYKDFFAAQYESVIDQMLNHLKVSKVALDGEVSEESVTQAYESVIQTIYNTLASMGEHSEEQLNAEMATQLLICSIFFVFIRENWTGPPVEGLNTKGSPLICIEGEANESAAYEAVYQLLCIDGETLTTSKIECLHHLYAVRMLVDVNAEVYKWKLGGLRWWRARSMRMHQQLMTHYCESLYTGIETSYRDILKKLADHGGEPLWTAEVEASAAALYYRDIPYVKRTVAHAFEGAGLKATFEGRLGKRTKFQQDDIAQLVVKTELAHPSPSTPAEGDSEGVHVPTGVLLDDDSHLLDAMKEAAENMDEEESEPLQPEHQALLLAEAERLRTCTAMDEVQYERIRAFADKLMESPKSWIIHSAVLLLRSRNEKARPKFIHRSALQMEALMTQFRDPEEAEKSDASTRMKHVFLVLYPPQTVIRREVADMFYSLGVVRGALDLYNTVDDYEGIVRCYRMIGQEATAEKILREQLAIKETPNLLCSLGEVTDDISLYEKAWELSKCRYARAKRLLGNHYFQKGEMALAAENYAAALQKSSMWPKTWFFLGCACLRLEGWEQARIAFARCTQQDEGDSEAWCNQAVALINMGQKSQALTVLKEAVRHCDRKKWKIWDNLLVAAMDQQDVPTALQALEVLADQQPIRAEPKILRAIVKYLVHLHQEGSAKAIVGEAVLRRTGVLLDTLCSLPEVSQFPEWYGLLAEWQMQIHGERDSAIESLRAQIRRAQGDTTWKTSAEQFRRTAKMVTDFLRLLAVTPVRKKDKSSGRLFSRSFLSQCKELWSESEEYREVELAAKELDAIESDE